jgi:hypothetical protein
MMTASRAEPRTSPPGPAAPAYTGRVGGAWWAAATGVVVAALLRILVVVLAPGAIGAPTRAAGVLAPVVALVAALAPGLATRRARRAPGVASLAAPAALGVLGLGWLLVDLTLLLDPVSAARPDLLPSGLSVLPASLAVLLVVADVLLVAAAVVAGRALVMLGRAGGAAVFGGHPPGVLVRPVAGAVLAAVGLAAAPFSVEASGTGFAPHAVLDTAPPAGVGVALLAVALVVVAVLPGLRPADPAADPETGMRVRRAVHTALGAAVVAGAAPVVAASIARPGLDVSPGAVLAIAGGLLLIGIPARTAVLRSRAAGVVALLAAGAALFGALLPTTTLSDSAPVDSGTGLLLLPAAAVLALPAVLVVVGTPRLVVRARPTLSVAWLTVPFAAGPALDVVLGAVDSGAPAADPAFGAAIPFPTTGVGVAAGGWAVVGALVLAVLTAVLAVGAGFAERRDVAGARTPLGARPTDGTDTVEPDPTMLPMCALAAVLAVPGFGGPLARDALAANAAGGVWQNPGAAAWGSLAGVVGVAIAVLLAPRARPARALALLAAAGALLVVRLSALVLTPPRPGESVGIGTWAAIVCLVVTLGAAVVSVLQIREERRPDDEVD